MRQAPLHRAAGEGSGEGVTAGCWVAIAVGSDAAWSALCATIGRPELAVDSRFADVVSRKHNEHAIDPIVAAWTRERSGEEVVTALRAGGVPAAPVQTSADLLSDVQLATRAFFTVVDRAHVGAHPYPDLPFRLVPAPEPDPRPAPCLGEHSEVVLRGLLGMTAAEYDALLHAEVTGTEPAVATDPSPASLERGA